MRHQCGEVFWILQIPDLAQFGKYASDNSYSVHHDLGASSQSVLVAIHPLTSTLFAVDEDGTVALHMMYDEWGNPQVDTDFNTNKSGVSNLNNYTSYTYDDVLGIYYAQHIVSTTRAQRDSSRRTRLRTG